MGGHQQAGASAWRRWREEIGEAGRRRACLECGTEFVPERPRSYCSARCRCRAWRRRGRVVV